MFTKRTTECSSREHRSGFSQFDLRDEKEKTMRRLLFIWMVTLGSWPLTMAFAQDPNPSAEAPAVNAEEEAIKQAVQAYGVAFNARDAGALAALWSPEGVYTNRITGEQVVGHTEIQEQIVSIFAEEKTTKLELTTNSIQFISPNVAVEHGTVKIIRENVDPEIIENTSVFIKRDGKWLLDRVTEEESIVVDSHYEHLQPLEWLVGTWRDQDDQATVLTEVKWAKNNNFLVRSFTVELEGEIARSGMQFIGWDPSTKTIRSWTFDSDGGFSQGTWKNRENRWYIHQSGVLPGGRKTSEVNIVTYLDDANCTLQSVNRAVDGDILPNIDEVKITKE
jgi:uncharacterized protein (TIGR02246 family)